MKVQRLEALRRTNNAMIGDRYCYWPHYFILILVVLLKTCADPATQNFATVVLL